MSSRQLSTLFNPKTIAVIGASDNPAHVGCALFHNLIGTGFDGTVYPVNPKREHVHGVKAYRDIGDIPGSVDLAMIATPAATVPEIVRSCGVKGVEAAVIVSSGFAEVGDTGIAMYRNIQQIGREYGMRILGPNCLGFQRPSRRLNASFARHIGIPGTVAFISQSGALGTAVLEWSVKQNVGLSCFVSIGEALDIGYHDLIDYFGRDPETQSIVLYMESLTNARRFLSAARSFSRSKPIIVLKAGRSLEGSKAALSHTGSMTGNDDVFAAAFRRVGIVRVETISELFDCAKTLATPKRPGGKKLAIVTNAGGPGVIATDALVGMGGELASLSDDICKHLDAVLPASWSRGNPIDLLGDADAQRYEAAIEQMIKSPEADGLLVILTPQAMTHAMEIADTCIRIAATSGKPLLAAWMGEDDVAEARLKLEAAGIPTYDNPEDAVRAFMHLYHYGMNLSLLYQTPATIPHQFSPKTEENRNLINDIFEQDRDVLTQEETMRLLTNYEIPVPMSETAVTLEDATAAAARIGFPVVLKIISPDISHKTEAGGVVSGISSEEELHQAYAHIMDRARAYKADVRIEGVMVTKHIAKRLEVLIGCKKDPVFGPAIVFGMGGIAVEVFHDTNIGLPPLNMALARHIIEHTKVFTLLSGYRGSQGVDIPAIEFVLYKFAYLVMDFPQIKEIDINPFGVDEEGGVVLDARVILDKTLRGQEIVRYSHMVISPYPREYETSWTMKNGQSVVLRPVKPEDEPMEGEMFTHFSEETQRFRFFGLQKSVTHELLIRYTQIDYDREIAIIGEITEENKKKMVGVVRLIADPYNENAEIALVVADPWQKQGLGDKMISYMLDIAKMRKIKSVYAYMLEDNFVMKKLCEKHGFSVKETDGILKAEYAVQSTTAA